MQVSITNSSEGGADAGGHQAAGSEQHNYTIQQCSTKKGFLTFRSTGAGRLGMKRRAQRVALEERPWGQTALPILLLLNSINAFDKFNGDANIFLRDVSSSVLSRFWARPRKRRTLLLACQHYKGFITVCLACMIELSCVTRGLAVRNPITFQPAD